jgi:hypothetical protein
MSRRRLKVRVSYEPNRLAKTYLSDAYEKLIPVIKHPVPREEDELEEKEKTIVSQMEKIS